MRLKRGREIGSPDKSRTTVRKPPLANPWVVRIQRYLYLWLCWLKRAFFQGRPKHNHNQNFLQKSFASDAQRIAKGAGGKGPRQKTSKIVKKCQQVFRHFSTIFVQGKKRQKSSKSVKKFFDTFRQFSRGTIFPAPFGGR